MAGAPIGGVTAEGGVDADGTDPGTGGMGTGGLVEVPETAIAGDPLVLVTAMPLPQVAVLSSGLYTAVSPGGQLTNACSSRRTTWLVPAALGPLSSAYVRRTTSW